MYRWCFYFVLLIDYIHQLIRTRSFSSRNWVVCFTSETFHHSSDACSGNEALAGLYSYRTLACPPEAQSDAESLLIADRNSLLELFGTAVLAQAVDSKDNLILSYFSAHLAGSGSPNEAIFPMIKWRLPECFSFLNSATGLSLKRPLLHRNPEKLTGLRI